jgi:hypothetical protein
MNSDQEFGSTDRFSLSAKRAPNPLENRRPRCLRSKLAREVLVSVWLALFIVPWVSAQPNTNCTPRPDGLVAWWRGDGTGYDVASTNHATPLTGANYGPGMAGQAFNLDGVDDFVQAGQSSDGNLVRWLVRTDDQPVADVRDQPERTATVLPRTMKHCSLEYAWGGGKCFPVFTDRTLFFPGWWLDREFRSTP